MSGPATSSELAPDPAPEPAAPGGLLRRGPAWLALNLRRDPLAALSLLVLFLAALAAVFADALYTEDPMSMVAMPFLWPGEDPSYPLGTDALGRDLAAGIVHGARVSLLVGFAAAFFGAALGMVIGAVAGYFGGWVDRLLMRVTEVFQIVPTMMLTIVIVAIRTPTVGLIILAIGLASWPVIARLTRAQFLVFREQEFIQAARVLGYGNLRIIASEILPNAAPAIIVAASVLVANAILIEAGLSFLNLGDPNKVSWGSLIGNGRAVLRTEWYLSAIPGLAIVLTVLAVNILGDRLTEILNPRSPTGGSREL